MLRRDFIKTSALTGGSALILGKSAAALAAPEGTSTGGSAPLALPEPKAGGTRLPDLSPARWLWYPSERTLPNTFILFRRELTLRAKPVKATGWVTGDSRYQLEVNGKRIQWGPAPCDPRWFEADPVDLTQQLQAGANAIGATVLFYGHGDGTWPFGRPGFLFWLEIEHADGSKEKVVSDEMWQAHICRAWQPGWYKRWFLRALQEHFDARLYPDGWSLPGFAAGASWVKAMVLEGSPNKPALSTKYQEYLQDPRGGPPESELRPRIIPLIDEPLIPVKQLAESLSVRWKRPSIEYFENRGPDCFEPNRQPCAIRNGDRWNVNLSEDRGSILTFEFEEQIVGFPYFSINAPAGTIVDLLTQEGHTVGGPALLYTTRTYCWARFICREGENRFECFDYESLRWLQLHIEGKGTVSVHSVGTRRRAFPWKHKPLIRSNEPALQRLFDANVNTTVNACIDQIVDGNGRERQQYSGCMAHQAYMALLAFGDPRLPARYYPVMSQGITKDGYFLDGWPAYDRLARMSQVQMGVFQMGAIVDGANQLVITAWQHYLCTGDLEPCREPYPRFIRFANYLIGLINRDDDGLLPVLKTGAPFVWMDYEAYKQSSGYTPDFTQRRKQCAWNLYVAHMFEWALSPMCETFGDRSQAGRLREVAAGLVERTVAKFWSAERRLFVDNLPWLAEEKTASLSDQSLAMAVLFDQCPRGDIAASVQVLADRPEEMGISHPENAQWRLWALAKAGRINVVTKELREIWATQPSVILNNTLQEAWQVKPDSVSQWSHGGVTPLSLAHIYFAGIQPLVPAFKRAEVWPKLGDLGDLELITHTAQGPIHFKTTGAMSRRTIAISMPEGCTGELVLKSNEKVALARMDSGHPEGHVRYVLPSGSETVLNLKNT